ncbi:MAG: HEAT repeat domain-containing protein, partial [Planctomycetota bacterium]
KGVDAVVRAKAERDELNGALADAVAVGDEEARAAAIWGLRQTPRDLHWHVPSARPKTDIDWALVLASSGSAEARAWGALWLAQCMRHVRASAARSEEARIREAADRKLGEMGEGDADARVRVFARVAHLWALGKETELAPAYRKAPAEERLFWLEAFREAGVGRAVAQVMAREVLAENNPATRRAAYEWLLGTGERLTAEEILAALELGSPRLAVRAVERMNSLGRDDLRAEVASKLVRSPLPAVRKKALGWAAAQLRPGYVGRSGRPLPELVVRILGTLAHDGDPRLRRDALILFAPHASPEHGWRLDKAYRELLKSGDEEAKLVAMKALARWGEPADEATILARLRSKDRQVQIAAFEAAGRTPGVGVLKAMLDMTAPEREDRHEWSRRLELILAKRAPELTDDEVRALMENFLVPSRPFHGGVGRPLSKLPGRERRLLPYVRRGLESPHPKVREGMAAWAVWLCGDVIRSELKRLGEDADAGVRTAVLSPQNRWDKDDPWLLGFVADKALKVRWYVPYSLQGTTTEAGVSALIELTKDKDHSTRRGAVRALLRCKSSLAARSVPEALNALPPGGASTVLRDAIADGHMPAKTGLVVATLRRGEAMHHASGVVGLLGRRKIDGPTEPVVEALLDIRTRAVKEQMSEGQRRHVDSVMAGALKRLTGLEDVSSDAVRAWLEKRAKREEGNE